MLMSLGSVAATAPTVWAAPGAPTPSAGPSQTCCHTELAVDGPAAVGLAGQPVEFTEKITNTSATESEDVFLNLVADAGVGMPENGLAIWYRADNGAWAKVPLEYSDGSFQGALPLTVTLGPGKSRVLHLRLGLPMGEPHNGDSDGGADSVKLTSSVGAADGSWVLQARDVRTVAVKGMTSSFTGVPATAVPGGAPVEFKATVANTTASDYVNVSSVLFTDRYATVRVFRAGEWVTLKPVFEAAEPDTAGFYLRGHDYAVSTGATSTVRVRISWQKNAPLGRTRLVQSVIVNEGGSVPFRGTYVGAASAQVTLTGGRSASPSPSQSPTASASASESASSGGTPTPTPTGPTTSAPAPTPSATSPASTGTQLASTGSDQAGTLVLSLGGGALVLAGGSLAAYTRLRRRA
ncbi:LPXTG cell wall anchor domain protein [Streptomyces turgidiscabies Car8]|uniref:LPXTG cell wall anchor domain protein n=1 Tax=Streptomyces turgidiscabies (strain Car8) TaxID=698760 RepID=L7EV19_STRT8|nr:LPXTG cell wall anchor domain protein [Streptomyces turgidiscabies Car8]